MSDATPAPVAPAVPSAPPISVPPPAPLAPVAPAWGRMFFICNLAALIVAALTAIPAFFTYSPRPTRYVATYSSDGKTFQIRSTQEGVVCDLAAPEKDVKAALDVFFARLDGRARTLETVVTPAGEILCTHVIVDQPDGPACEVWIGKEAPHLLVRWVCGPRMGVLTQLER